MKHWNALDEFYDLDSSDLISSNQSGAGAHAKELVDLMGNAKTKISSLGTGRINRVKLTIFCY